MIIQGVIELVIVFVSSLMGLLGGLPSLPPVHAAFLWLGIFDVGLPVHDMFEAIPVFLGVRGFALGYATLRQLLSMIPCVGIGGS